MISPTFGGYGGLEAFVIAIAAGLPPSATLDVRVFFKRTAGFVLRPELEASVAPLGERVHFVDRGSGELKRAIMWADVVHAQNASADVVLLARFLRRRVLLTMHSHRLAGNAWRQRLWDFCLRLAHRRFFVSGFVRRTWEGAAPRPRSEVVFPICELPFGTKPPEARHGFVFAARWIANKGIDTLVDAYAQAALDPVKWPLRLIGDGPLRSQIERRIATLGVRGIEMLGFVSQAAKAEAIRSARWMIVPPNTNEDFGLTAIEARAVGVPCIITRDGGVPEAAGGEAIACAPGDVTGLAACLRAAAAMPEPEYIGRGNRTRETLQRQLAGPEFYARVYHELVGR